MKIQRFFIGEKIAEEKKVTVSNDELIHQWRNVFRMKAGDEIVLLDNSGFEYPARFLSLDKKEAEFEVLSKIKNEVIPKREVVLYQSLIKKDKFEWVVQKATELGVSEFVPVLSERSEKKNLNMERLAVIAREASEQSGRGKLPKLHKLLNLQEALDSIKDNAIVFDSSGFPFQTYKLPNFLTYKIFIGPEGGFTSDEIQLFKSKNIPIVSLGNMTLRAETAAISVASFLLL